jgi:hypothetical protein
MELNHVSWLKLRYIQPNHLSFIGLMLTATRL